MIYQLLSWISNAISLPLRYDSLSIKYWSRRSKTLPRSGEDRISSLVPAGVVPSLSSLSSMARPAALLLARLLASVHCTSATTPCNRGPQGVPVSHHPRLLALITAIARDAMSSAVLRMLTRIKISRITVTDSPIPWCHAPLRSLPSSLGEPACSPPSGLCSPGAPQDFPRG